MRKSALLFTATALLTVTAAYIVAPLVTAVQLRHAIATGDAPTVQRMIEWPSFRDSLRYAIARNAELLPAAKDAARSVRPTLWQRIRSLFGHSMLDRFMETHITPEGLTKLYQARQYRAGIRPPAVIKAGVSFDQVREIWARVKRAQFISLSRFVLELDDPEEPGRRIRCLFILDGISLTGFSWKLHAVAIDQPRAPAPARRLSTTTAAR